ncbi:MAG: hypothetical protein DHS20C11_11230 [Lysobacteraceae bacterium]|nr:MAG: hypothetical protein DHS20C11_11230 [Xanthomonadaceae bacterium]
MDRPINSKTRQLARTKQLATWLLAIGILAIAFLLLRNLLRPGIDLADVRTAAVERGDVQATISASGTVVPRTELIISSNFPAEIRQVLVTTGTRVESGSPLLILDARPIEVAIQDLNEKISLKENERTTARLRLEKAINEATGRYELRKIDLESHTAKFNRYSALADSGLISKGELLEAELDVRRSSVELEQLEAEMRNQQSSNEAELERITLEAAILNNQLDEQQRLLALTTVTAPQAGVVTWIPDQIGTSIAQGQPLARIADLSAYRVEATMSDFYAPQLTEGLAVDVTVGGNTLSGHLASILPTVDNGAMQMLIELDQPSSPGLRPQLRGDVDIITGRSTGTLRIRKGPGLQGSGQQAVYRIDDSIARRVTVTLGLSNRDYVEILHGLSEGDVAIVSDSADFEHLDQVEVN